MYIREKIKEGAVHNSLLSFTWDELTEDIQTHIMGYFDLMTVDTKEAILQKLRSEISIKGHTPNDKLGLMDIGLVKTGNLFYYINYIPISIIPYYNIKDWKELKTYY